MGYIPISFITAVVFFIIPIQIQLPHISKSAVRLQQFSGFGTEPILNRKKPFYSRLIEIKTALSIFCNL